MLDGCGLLCVPFSTISHYTMKDYNIFELLQNIMGTMHKL